MIRSEGITDKTSLRDSFTNCAYLKRISVARVRVRVARVDACRGAGLIKGLDRRVNRGHAIVWTGFTRGAKKRPRNDVPSRSRAAVRRAMELISNVDDQSSVV